MSARKLSVILTRRAQEDLRQIRLYGLSTWGERRQADYDAYLPGTFALIGDYPEIGRIREDLRPGYRAHPVEQHVIFYRVTASRVSSSRILHQRADARRELG